jgi:DNA-directed DNA polymerase III PolC
MAADAIASHLADAGYPAGALLDRGNLCGALDFYEACLARDVKPLVGVELTCPVTDVDCGLVALDRGGYASLCAAVSAAHLEPDRRLVDVIEQVPGGLAAFTGEGPLALKLRDLLGQERTWLEIVANRDTPAAIREKTSFARAHSLHTLATWDTWCLDEGQYPVSRVLKAIGEGKTVDEVRLDAREPALVRANLERALGDRPEVLRESLRLAEMVDLKLDLGTPHFPRVGATPGESLARLEGICALALRDKYVGCNGAARARLAEELRVVGGLGMADYFLVVADIVAFALREGIPVAGRGSGAGSIIAYLLGITQSDPVAEDLLFERFLNELRPDYPDLDIDLSWKRRDEVIDYVYRRFGPSNVAMISTRACFELRLAAREVAKAFGLGPYEAQSLADRLPFHDPSDARGSIERALGNIKPELAPGMRGTIGELAAAIVGFPNHSSVHCGGIVVSDRPITYYTPLEMAAKGIQVTQFDMRAIERIGLIKIDLLGNRALSIVEEANREIGLSRGGLAEVRPEDQATADILRSGRTVSCFQLESPAMRGLLRMLKASTRSDATLALALVRPGPSAGGMKARFIERRTREGRRTQEGWQHQHGQHSGDAAPPNDLPVYEEDFMRLIAEATGAGLAEADIFRSSLKHGDDERGLRDKFVFLATTAGRPEAEALRVWETVRRFARYTFCKAHAISFGTIAYATAYLKANFPLEFYAAVLRNHSGMYPIWVHVNEARRVGVRVVPPSINNSAADFAIQEGVIRAGLGSVKHLSRATTDAILAARRGGRFHSLVDFLDRVRADREETLALLGSGAFDEVETERCAALTLFLTARGRLRGAGTPPLGFPEPLQPTTARAFTPLEKRRMEYAALGFSPLLHPLELFEADGRRAPAPRPLAAGHTGASCAGLLAALRHYRDKGPGLWFVSLDTPDRLVECIVPDHVVRPRLEIGLAYRVSGTVQTRFDVPSLRATAVAGLAEKYL